MVRENETPPVEKASPGVDGNKSVNLTDELKAAGKWQGDTVDPEHTMTREPIDIRGDAEPEKRG